MIFSATLNDGGFINITADRMKMNEPFLLVYRNGDLVALIELNAIVEAHVS